MQLFSPGIQDHRSRVIPSSFQVITNALPRPVAISSAVSDCQALPSFLHACLHQNTISRHERFSFRIKADQAAYMRMH